MGIYTKCVEVQLEWYSQPVQSPDTAVVPLSNPQQDNNIPPMFQTLKLLETERQLKLIVDSAFQNKA